MAKLLSVIVPSYNMEKYLHKCLGSFGVEQLMERKGVDGESLAEKLEVIVVNDGSKDRTSEIAHEFERKYPTIFQVIDKANGHYGSCINCGLKKTYGTFVRVLDADDYFSTPDFCAFLQWLDRMECANPGIIELVFNGRDRVDPDGQVLESMLYSFPTGRIFEISEASEKFQVMATLTYRTSRLLKVGYFQPEHVLYSDNMWTFAPLAGIRYCAYFDRIVYKYLIGRPGQSMDTSVWSRNTHQMVVVFNAMLDFFERVRTSLHECNREIMEDALLNIGQIIYGMLFYHVVRHSAAQMFAEVDARVKDVSPFVYERLGQNLAFTAIHPFAYVDYCRKHSTSFGMVAVALRIYKASGLLLKRIMGRG